ncbi:MAG: hypothetical protein ACREST_02295 [Steroidobacteraceae bacterium]
MAPPPLIVAALSLLGSLTGAALGTGHFSRAGSGACTVDAELQPVATLLGENRQVLADLESNAQMESESAMLDTYLARIRRDGVPLHSAMKRRIDRLVDNNTVILVLLSKCAPRARSPRFAASTEQFRDYAISLRDRWQSVFEIFMTGGYLPAAGPELPEGVVEAVSEEIAAAG